MYPVTPSGCFVMQLRSRVAFVAARKYSSSSIPCSARSPPPKSSIRSQHLYCSSLRLCSAADTACSSEEDSARSPPPKSSIRSQHLRRSSSRFRPAADTAFSSEEDSDGHSHTSSVLGGGSSDDDDSSSSSSDDDNDSALYAPEPADEDDATVAEWRRNSYSASTLVLFVLVSMRSCNIIHV